MIVGVILILLSQESLEVLLQRLDGNDIADRQEAVRKLMDRDLVDLPALEKAYRESGDAERRARLQKVLSGVRRRRHAELLRELEGSSDAVEREIGRALAKPDANEVLRLLAGRGSDRLDRTFHALLDLCREDEEVVRAALREKPVSWPLEFAPRAVPYLSDPDVRVCHAAHLALTGLKERHGSLAGVEEREVAARVAANAATEGHACRQTALEALPVLGDERSIDALLLCLGSDDAVLQPAGLKALRGYLERRPGLSKHARAAELLLASPSEEIRRLAYEALAVHPRPEVDLARVRKELEGESARVRWGAMELAVALGDSSLAPGIARRLPEKDGPKAVEALFRLSPACAAEHLGACFEHQPGLTEDWIEYLARHAPPKTLEPIRRALGPVIEKGDRKVRASALHLAYRLEAGFDAERLAAAAQVEDDYERKTAFERISTALTPRGVDVLRAGLADKDRWVRREAAKAAGRAKASACKDDLLRLLVSDPENRDDAITALGLLGDRGVVAHLLAHVAASRAAREAVGLLATAEEAGSLLGMARETVDANVRQEIVDLAARLLGDRAVGVLRSLLDDRRLRGSALSALAARGAVECAPDVLKHLSDSDPRAVRAAASLLGKARHAEAVPRLLELLPESDVRESAAEALARMPRSQVAPKVAPLLRSRDASLRETAARLLSALDADEIVAEIREVLGDDSPRVARHGVETVRRRKLQDCLVEVERLSRHPEAGVRREALETLAELDWAGRRAKLLERLEDPAALLEIGPLFGVRQDVAALPILLRRAGEAGDAGYDALVVLNSYRKPVVYARAAQPTLRGIGTIFGDSLEEKARRLSRDSGWKVRSEVAPPPPPRASFESAFDPTDGQKYGSSRSSAGGGRYRSGDYSLLQKLREGLGPKVVPILEDDAVRLVAREKAKEFWSTWARERK